MTQRQRVLEYMQENRSISSLEAFKELGVTRLSAVIFDLKADGHCFGWEDETVKNRYGENVKFRRYFLME